LQRVSFEHDWQTEPEVNGRHERQQQDEQAQSESPFQDRVTPAGLWLSITDHGEAVGELKSTAPASDNRSSPTQNTALRAR
jgi:hypothetical protein